MVCLQAPSWTHGQIYLTRTMGAAATRPLLVLAPAVQETHLTCQTNCSNLANLLTV